MKEKMVKERRLREEEDAMKERKKKEVTEKFKKNSCRV